MRIVQYHNFGNPKDVLRVNQVPQPAMPGPEQLLVRVIQRPVHPGDLLGVEGRYSGATAGTPVAAGAASPGFEGMGVIEAVGSNVDTKFFSPGMRVAFFPASGAWGELALVPAQFATAIPAEISDEVAAQLHVTPLTALMLLRAAIKAGVGPQGAMVVTAAGSSVAKLLTAFALQQGLQVIGIVRSSEGVVELAELNPQFPVVTTESNNWRAELSEKLGGTPIRAVVDAVGGSLPSELFERLTSGGTLISYGNLTGEPLNVPALMFSVRDLHIEGVSVGRWGGLPIEQRQKDLQSTLDLARRQPQLLPVARVYDLDEVAAAVVHSKQARKVGAVLLRSAAK